MPDPIVSAAPDAFDRDAVKALFALPREELFARADAVRQQHMGDEVLHLARVNEHRHRSLYAKCVPPPDRQHSRWP